MGRCLLGLEQYEEALKIYEEALAAKRQTLPPGGEQLQFSYDGVGQVLLGLAPRVAEVDPWLQSLPEEPSHPSHRLACRYR